MTDSVSYLRLNRLRVLQATRVIYDEEFHEGINIIRGQNGSGKSTIADFIFYILGGEFDNWKDAARHCDEVHAEVQTPRGKLTLKREINTSQQPVQVFFGPVEEATESTVEGWESFPIRRQANYESFSQVMFQSMRIPEARSDGASNITMHQLLRLCYSDQRTPTQRLFRFERFDTHSIREAVGDLICGVKTFELYETELDRREEEKRLDEVKVQLRALQRVFGDGDEFTAPEQVDTEVSQLRAEAESLRGEIERVEDFVESEQVDAFLQERKNAQAILIRERREIANLEIIEKNLEYEMEEINEFIEYLDELKEKVTFAEATSNFIGSIEFTHCPACGEQLEATNTNLTNCIVCKQPIDQETNSTKFNLIFLDLDLQTRESRQLIEQKKSERRTVLSKLRTLRHEHEKVLSSFNLRFSTSNGPQDAFLRPRIKRLGQIETKLEFLLKDRERAEQFADLSKMKIACEQRIKRIREKETVLRALSEKRRSKAHSQTSESICSILRSDLPRQDEFVSAARVEIDFRNDSVSLDGQSNFAESSNVILKNATVFAFLLAAANDQEFYHPRFVLIDNIEDKGMEEERSHLFQQTLINTTEELESPFQVIFTTSMVNPELELEKYTIGPPYTSVNPSLKFTD